MLGLGHLPEILLICLVALVILGPKRMIDIGAALGRALRELREATKDLNWNSLLDSGGERSTSQPTSSTLGAISQFTQSLTNSVKEMGAQPSSSPAGPPPSNAAPSGRTTIVDGTVDDKEPKESNDQQVATEDKA